MNRFTIVINLCFAILAFIALAVPVGAAAAELNLTRSAEVDSTLRASEEGQAIAVAAEIAVSDTDSTDVVTWVGSLIALPAPPEAGDEAAVYALRVATDGTVTWVAAAAAAPAEHPDAYIAWSADTDFTAAEFTAGLGVEGAREGAIPAQTGFAYLGLWLEGDHWDGVTEITIDHGPNGLSTMVAAAPLAIDGVAGQYRRYIARQSGDVLTGRTMRW